MGSAIRSLLALTLVVGVGSAQERPTAPDGRPGLGVHGTARAYGAFWRSPSDEERALLDSLLGLPGEVLVLRSALERSYRDAGLFALVADQPGAELEQLHAAYLELSVDPIGALRAGGERAKAFARAFLDARFRLRLETLAGLPAEARELRGGLALLRATQDGFVELKDPDARVIAGRVDLAAALLRAFRLDLEALGRSVDATGPGAPDPAWLPLLEEVAAHAEPGTRPPALADLMRRVGRTEARMRESLFTPRLRQAIGSELWRRDAGRDRASGLLREVRVLLPDTEEGARAPASIAELRKHQRYAYALRYAVEGLSQDPFEDELCYWAGIATDFLHDRWQSRVWFDRYLALRGIRAHLPETFARELGAEERYALELVQSVPPLPR